MKGFSTFPAITALLFAAAVLLGIGGQREITTLRSEQATLAAKVEALPPPSDGPITNPRTERRTPRPRTKNPDPLPGIRSSLITLVRRMNHHIGFTGEDLIIQKDIVALQQSLRTLGITQIQSLLEEFRDSTGLSDDARKHAISILIAAATEQSPQTVLDMLKEDKYQELPYRHDGMLAAIRKLSHTDPYATMAWIRSQPADSPWIKNLLPQVIEHTAYSDPQVAVELIREYGAAKYLRFTKDIPEALTDASQCGEWIDILRASPDLFDSNKRIEAIGKMGAPLARQGFEEGTLWISDHLKEPEEIASMLNAITHDRNNLDPGRWIEWAGSKLPDSMRDNQIETMISNWTTRDHLAAGEWLVALPDSPTRIAAVAGFAKTVAPFEPDAAMEWAQTLPAGAVKDATLREIQKLTANAGPAPTPSK